MVAYLDLLAAMRDGHRQLDEFVAEGPRPDPFDGIDWGPIVAATTCPSCGMPLTGTVADDHPPECDCEPDPGGIAFWTCMWCGHTAVDGPTCDKCGHTMDATPYPDDPDPDHLTACLAEARFGLEEALERLETYKPLIHPPTYDYIVSQIKRAIEVLP